MVEIKVTYETLFDLLRREKGRNELQELEKTFYEDVESYLKEKIKSLNTISSRGEKEKINIQLKNVRKILRELYELREKKIINLAASKVRTSSNLIDTSKLLVQEQFLFDEACALFSKYKTKILEKIISEDVSYDDSRDVVPEKVVSAVVEKQVVSDSSESNKIKLLQDLPRFLGTDKKIYGPYKKGDVAELPLATAELLLDKNRAERV